MPCTHVYFESRLHVVQNLDFCPIGCKPKVYSHVFESHSECLPD